MLVASPEELSSRGGPRKGVLGRVVPRAFV